MTARVTDLHALLSTRRAWLRIAAMARAAMDAKSLDAASFDARAVVREILRVDGEMQGRKVVGK